MVGSAATLTDAARGHLVLQIRGTSRDGQRVRIASGKCTIGSGPRCTLRLRARGVRPLHCLIVSGNRATMIRRWAPDTLLNGRTFTDAELVPGDRLSVGPIEFSVVQTAGSSHRRSESIARAAGPAETPPRYPQSRPPDEATRQGRQRARRLHDQLRQAREEVSLLQQQREKWELRQGEADSASAGQVAASQARLAELEARQEELQQERRHWETERDVAQRQLHQRAGELDARAAELVARQEEVREQREEWELRRGETESASVEQAAAFQARLAELEARQEEIQQERLRWESERDEVQRQLDKQAGELDARATEFESQEEEFQQRCDQWDSQRADLQKRLDEQCEELGLRQAELEAAEKRLPQDREDPASRDAASEPPGASQRLEDLEDGLPWRTSPTEAGAPVDTAEVLRQMGAVPLLPDDEPEDNAGPADEPLAGMLPPSPEPSGEDESIDDYMARLLDRVRHAAGDTRPLSPPTAYAPPQVSQRSPAEAVKPAPQPDMPRPRAGGKPRGPVEMSPRAVAPEKSADLSAMRALANDSAQSAIDHHARQQTVSAIRVKLLVAILALAAGGATAWAWWAELAPVGALYAAVAAFAVAGFWGLQYLVLAGGLIVRRSRGRRRRIAGEQPRHSASTGRAEAAEEPSRDETPEADEIPEASDADQPPQSTDSRTWRELERAASSPIEEPPEEA